MMIEKKCKYIYFHYLKDNDKPFYVGQGATKKQYKTKFHRSIKWNEYVKDKEWYSVIICSGLTENEANDLEVKYIKDFGRIDIDDNGILVNQSIGAQFSRYGLKTNKEIIKKMKKTRNSLEYKKKMKEVYEQKRVSFINSHIIISYDEINILKERIIKLNKNTKIKFNLKKLFNNRRINLNKKIKEIENKKNLNLVKNNIIDGYTSINDLVISTGLTRDKIRYIIKKYKLNCTLSKEEHIRRTKEGMMKKGYNIK